MITSVFLFFSGLAQDVSKRIGGLSRGEANGKQSSERRNTMADRSARDVSTMTTCAVD